MPFIESLKLTEFTDIVEDPRQPDEGVQGMYIRASDFEAELRDGHSRFHPVVGVRSVNPKEMDWARFLAKGLPTPVFEGPVVMTTVLLAGNLKVERAILNPDVRLFWRDDRTDNDVREMLYELEARSQ
jgi:hypothetical protein